MNAVSRITLIRLPQLRSRHARENYTQLNTYKYLKNTDVRRLTVKNRECLVNDTNELVYVRVINDWPHYEEVPKYILSDILHSMYLFDLKSADYVEYSNKMKSIHIRKIERYENTYSS